MAFGLGLALAEVRSCLKKTNPMQAIPEVITGMVQSQVHGGKQPSGPCCISTSTQLEALALFFFISKLEVAELFFHHTVLLLLLQGETGSCASSTSSLAVPVLCPGSSRAGLQDELPACQGNPVILVRERDDPR